MRATRQQGLVEDGHTVGNEGHILAVLKAISCDPCLWFTIDSGSHNPAEIAIKACKNEAPHTEAPWR